MANCDVCGKNSLLPEKLGSVNICKICFMKTNGLLWKKKYERFEDAEKQRNKTLESAHKNNFPQPVISAINSFFTQQIQSMQKCNCCNHPVQHLQPFGNAEICNQCFAKINTSAWREENYDDNNQVEENRKKILRIATKNGFPAIITEAINMHFDKKIQKGLICTSEGSRRQKLKVFETYCILITDEHFDKESVSKEYAKAIKSAQNKDGFFTNENAKSLAKSVIKRGVVGTGISIATSAAINAAADAFVPEKAVFKVNKGEFLIDYLVFDNIYFQERGNNDIGFIRFRNSDIQENPEEDIVFFFYSDTDNESLYNLIIHWATETRQAKMKQQEPAPIAEAQVVTAPPVVSAASVAEDIMRFKNLLDIGAITQEEYDIMKKQLLGL